MIINIGEVMVKKVRIFYDVKEKKYSAKITWEDSEYMFEKQFDLSDYSESTLFEKIISLAGVDNSKRLKRRKMRVAEYMFTGEVFAVGSKEKDEWLLLNGKNTETYTKADLYEKVSEFKEPIFW